MGKKWKTIEEIREFIESNSDCKLITKERTFIKNEKYKLLCHCGNEFNVRMSAFRNGQKQCPSCGARIRNDATRLTIEQVREYVRENSECELISDVYDNANKKIKFRCFCGNEFEKTFASFKESPRKLCKECYYKSASDSYSLTIEEASDIVGKFSSSKVLDVYKYDNKNYVKLKCECGSIYNVRLSWIKQGGSKRCKKCTGVISALEYEAMRVLDNMNIKYENEKMFDDLKHKTKLRIDLYLCDLNIAIELDGRQHYEPIKFFGGEKTFERIKLRDHIKDKYCKENNIKLIRIRYDEINNIEKILKKALL